MAWTAALSSAFIALSLASSRCQVLQFLGGHPAAGLPGQVARAHPGQQSLVLADRFLHRRTAGDQIQEQPVQPVEGLGPGAGQLITAVAQHPQHGQLRIGADFAQSLVPQRDHDDRVRVRGVGLAALPGIEHPGPGSQLGRHIQHPFPAGQQPLREGAADAVRTLHRPDPLGPLPGDARAAGGSCAHRCANRPVARKISRLSRASIVTDSLCGSTPMITLSTSATSFVLAGHLPARTGNAISSCSRPFLSHASPRHPARTHAMKEPRPYCRRAAARRASGQAPHPSLRRPGRSWKT